MNVATSNEDTLVTVWGGREAPRLWQGGMHDM